MWGFFDETNLPPSENKIYFNKICQKHFPMVGGKLLNCGKSRTWFASEIKLSVELWVYSSDFPLLQILVASGSGKDFSAISN